MAVVAGDWPETRRDSDLGHGGRSGWHVRVALVAARLLELGGAQKRACGHVCEEARGGRGLRPRRNPSPVRERKRERGQLTELLTVELTERTTELEGLVAAQFEEKLPGGRGERVLRRDRGEAKIAAAPGRLRGRRLRGGS